MERAAKYIRLAFQEYDYLQGDSCKSTYEFLVSFVEVDFKLAEGRRPDEFESQAIAEAVEKFLNYTK